MDNEFYTLPTDRGMAKSPAPFADKNSHICKDGGWRRRRDWKYYEPTASQTNLRHEVWRGEMNTLTVAPNNPNWLIAELVLPETLAAGSKSEVAYRRRGRANRHGKSLNLQTVVARRLR